MATCTKTKNLKRTNAWGHDSRCKIALATGLQAATGAKCLHIVQKIINFLKYTVIPLTCACSAQNLLGCLETLRLRHRVLVVDIRALERGFLNLNQCNRLYPGVHALVSPPGLFI